MLRFSDQHCVRLQFSHRIQALPTQALHSSACGFSYTQAAMDGCHLMVPSLNHRPISFSALGTESEPWMMFLQRID